MSDRGYVVDASAVLAVLLAEPLERPLPFPRVEDRELELVVIGLVRER